MLVAPLNVKVHVPLIRTEGRVGIRQLCEEWPWKATKRMKIHAMDANESHLCYSTKVSKYEAGTQ